MDLVLPVSLATAAAMAILTLGLMMQIGRVRMKNEVMHGDGGNPLLARRIRAQLNFVETGPFILALIVLIELAGRGDGWLHWVAGFYLAARVLHAIGMDVEGATWPRILGIFITMLTLVELSVVAALILLGAM